jgi:hypothetical protein
VPYSRLVKPQPQSHAQRPNSQPLSPLPQLLDPCWAALVDSSLVVDGIPHEVSVCVGLGAGSSVVRVVGLREEDNHMKSFGKNVKDLWDEDNVVPPLTLKANLKLRSNLWGDTEGFEAISP